MSRRLTAVALVLVACALPAGAQRNRRAAAPIQPPGQSVQRAAPAGDSAERARLEGEVRRRFAQAVRNRVGLSDEQLNRLIPLSQRYEAQRRQLLVQEREARLALRATMRNEAAADAARVDRLLRALVEVNSRRAQLLEAEQRDLAAIMTPVQRAKYMAMQEQIRRRLEQMRQQRMPQLEGDAVGPPRRRPQR